MAGAGELGAVALRGHGEARAGADLSVIPGMHRHTLQFQPVEDVYMYL